MTIIWILKDLSFDITQHCNIEPSDIGIKNKFSDCVKPNYIILEHGCENSQYIFSKNPNYT